MTRNSNTGRNSRTRSRLSNGHFAHDTTWASALGMLGGAGLGAFIMYVFDPDQGRSRRHRMTEMAGQAVDSATGAVGDAFHHAKNHAGEIAAAAPAVTPHAADLRGKAAEWFESAKERLPYRFASRSSQQMTGACAASIAATALVAGMGAMWLFDPARGRARRAWIMQKGTRAVHETGHFMSATGRHVRNKAKGYAHQASDYAHEVMPDVMPSRVSEEA